MDEEAPPWRAVGLVCSLSPSPQSTSSELLAAQLVAELARDSADTGRWGCSRG